MVKNLIQAIEMKRNITNKGVMFIKSRTEEEMIPYSILYKKARGILRLLQHAGINAHDKVIFQLEDNEEFIITFWACILGKIIPIPIPTDTSKEGVQRVFRIFDKLDRPLIAMNKDRYESLGIKEQALLKNKYMIIDKNQAFEEVSYSESVISDDANSDEAAFVQFSSGSTGEPKGVVITHENIMALVNGMNEKMGGTAEDSTINWMPLAHNTGLIAGHLFSTIFNMNCYLIETKLFLMDPAIWFEKISQYRGTFACCPNFGYKHCIKMLKNKRLKNVDLSSLKMMLNGAEPISKKVCDEFVETFGIYGLNKNVIVPTYGSSETTGGITSADLYEPVESFKIDIKGQFIGSAIKYVNEEKANDASIEVVSVGRPIGDAKIRIVNDEGIDIGEDRRGYLQVKGKTVCKGYYGMERGESEIFDKEGWLNTGDIGFIHKGKLIINGRDKDVIFVNGRNYYSSDLENLLMNKGILEECAVSAWYNQEKSCDQIAVFVQVNDERQCADELAARIRQIIFKGTNLKVDYVIPIQQIPRGRSGKVQRDKLQGAYKDEFLKAAGSKQAEPTNEDMRQTERIRLVGQIQNVIQELIGFKIEDLNKSLLDYGIDSIKVPQFKVLLEERLKREIPVSIIFDYPTINQMADYLLGDRQEIHKDKQTREYGQDIAIIGLGCRFPAGADNPAAFWEKLLSGQEFITQIPEGRKELFTNAGVSMDIEGGFIEDIASFDAEFFNITPLEAKYMDPQQRLLLEVAYEAMQSAGINHAEGSSTGVFVGISSNDYLEICKAAAKENVNNYMITGNMHNIAAGRIGYAFDLHGPIMAIDTACSSSMVAVHEAAKSLNAGECDMAIAGGVNLILSPQGYAGLERMGALSPVSRCKTFDNAADGYVRSEGCGMIVLKRLEDALGNHDEIWAVIKGSALNHDGRSSGLTAPNGLAQEEVVKKAIKAAGMTPEEIDYIEAHGTGTKLGDPQEINALANVFSHIENKKILLGSVKSNIGHTESAAGIASLIKVILALKNRWIPANANFSTPNQYINWNKMPFEIVDRNYEWNNSKALTAGISSFGLSGTNVHMILKEFREAKHERKEAATNILTLSANRQEMLIKEIENYIEYMAHSNESLTDICATSHKLKTDKMYKMAWTGSDKKKLILEMQRSLKSKRAGGKCTGGKITFMFDSEESIYMNMGRELYDNNAVFKRMIEKIETVYEEVVGRPLKDLLFRGDINGLSKKYTYTIVAAFEYALVEMWKAYGVIPEQVMGYGVGEYVAAYTAGMITVKEALKLAYEKGRIMDNVPQEFKQLIVFEAAEAVEQLISNHKLQDTFITSVGSSKNVSVAVSKGEINRLIDILEANNYLYLKDDKSLQPNREEIENKKDEFSRTAREITYQLPDKKFISLDVACKEGVNTFMYWTNSLYRINNFYKAVSAMEDSNIFIEIGGGIVLSSLVTEILGDNMLIMPSIRKIKGECMQIGEVICNLYEAGKEIRWEAVDLGYQAKTAQLPNSVYMKKSYWVN